MSVDSYRPRPAKAWRYSLDGATGQTTELAAPAQFARPAPGAVCFGSPPGWGTVEPEVGKYEEPKARLSDDELRALAAKEPPPLPEHGDVPHEHLHEAWDAVGRLWPEMASKVTRIGQFDHTTLPKDMRSIEAFMNPWSGELHVRKGQKLDPSSLWHELVHREQHHRGLLGDRPRPRTDFDGKELPDHNEVEAEAHQRQHHAKGLLKRFEDIRKVGASPGQGKPGATEMSLRFDLASPPRKQTRESAFGYVEMPKGAIEATFAQCASCVAFTGSRCLSFRPGDRVTPSGACNLYVYGQPVAESEVTDDCFGGLKPKDAGYVEAAVRCQNCTSFHQKATHGECELYEKLNEAQPHYWGLLEHVKGASCCNAWTGSGDGQRLSLGATRMAAAHGQDGRDAAPGVYLFRHGKTKLNTDGESPDLIRGWLDVPLDKQGREQAEKLAPMGEAFDIKAVYSSDLQRARATADAVAGGAGLGVEATQALRPWNLGEFQGKSAADSAPKLKHFATEEPDTPVPGGESFEDYCNRFLPFLHKAMEEHERDGKNVALVTHYRNCKLAEAWVDGGCGVTVDGDTFFSDDLPTGAVLRLYREGGEWRYERVPVPGMRMSVSVRFAADEPTPFHEVRELPEEGGHGVFGEGEAEPKAVFRGMGSEKHANAHALMLNKGKKGKDDPLYRPPPPKAKAPGPKAPAPESAPSPEPKGEGGGKKVFENATQVERAAATNPKSLEPHAQEMLAGKSPEEREAIVKAAQATVNGNPGEKDRQVMDQAQQELVAHATGQAPQMPASPATEQPPQGPAAGDAGKAPRKPASYLLPGEKELPKGQRQGTIPDMAASKKQAGELATLPQSQEKPPAEGPKMSPKDAPIQERQPLENIRFVHPGSQTPVSGQIVSVGPDRVRVETDYGENLTLPRDYPHTRIDDEESPRPVTKHAAGSEVEFEHPGHPGHVLRGKLVGTRKHRGGESQGVQRAGGESVVVDIGGGRELHLPPGTLAKAVPPAAPAGPRLKPGGMIKEPPAPVAPPDPAASSPPAIQPDLPGMGQPPPTAGTAGREPRQEPLPGVGEQTPPTPEAKTPGVQRRLPGMWEPSGRSDRTEPEAKTPDMKIGAKEEEARRLKEEEVAKKADSLRDRPLSHNNKDEYDELAKAIGLPEGAKATGVIHTKDGLAGVSVEHQGKKYVYNASGPHAGKLTAVEGTQPGGGGHDLVPPEDLGKAPEKAPEAPPDQGVEEAGARREREAKEGKQKRKELRDRIKNAADANAKQILQEGAASASPEVRREADEAKKRGQARVDQLVQKKGFSFTQKALALILGSVLFYHYARRHPGGLAMMLGLAGMYFLLRPGKGQAAGGDDGEYYDDAEYQEDLRKEAQGLLDHMTKPGDPKIPPDWQKAQDDFTKQQIDEEDRLRSKGKLPSAGAGTLPRQPPPEPPPAAATTPKPPQGPPQGQGAAPGGQVAPGSGSAPMGTEEAQRALEAEASKHQAAGQMPETTARVLGEEQPVPAAKKGVRVGEKPLAELSPDDVFDEIHALQIKGEAGQLPPELQERYRLLQAMAGTRLEDMPDVAAKRATDRVIAQGGDASQAQKVGEAVRDYVMRNGTNRMLDHWKQAAEGGKGEAPASAQSPASPPPPQPDQPHPAAQWQNEFERAHGWKPGYRDTAEDPYGEFRLINQHASHGGEEYRGQNARGDIAKRYQKARLDEYKPKDFPKSGWLVTSEENWPGKGRMPEEAKGWTLIAGGDEVYRGGVSHAIPPGAAPSRVASGGKQLSLADMPTKIGEETPTLSRRPGARKDASPVGPEDRERAAHLRSERQLRTMLPHESEELERLHRRIAAADEAQELEEHRAWMARHYRLLEGNPPPAQKPNELWAQKARRRVHELYKEFRGRGLGVPEAEESARLAFKDEDPPGQNFSLAQEGVLGLAWADFVGRGGNDTKENFRRMAADVTRLSLALPPEEVLSRVRGNSAQALQ